MNTPPKLRYIFLDIDGVLNSYALQEFGMKSSLLKKFKKTLPQNDASVENLLLRLERCDTKIYDSELDPLRIGAVANLCNKYNAKVVLSSSWRNYFHETLLDEVFHRLNNNWRRGTMISSTTKESYNRRWDQIWKWVETIPHSNYEIVVLDDDPSAFPDNDFDDPRFLFIMTQCDDALLYSDYMRVESFFKKG